MYLYQWSCFFLLCACAISVVGLFARAYKENLVQNAGMCLLILGCPSRIVDLWQHESVPFDWFMIHAAIGLISIGIFIKVWARRRREQSFAKAWHSVEADWARYNRGELAVAPPDRRQHSAVH